MTTPHLPADLEARVVAGEIRIQWNEMSRAWIWDDEDQAAPTLQELREAVAEAKEETL